MQDSKLNTVIPDPTEDAEPRPVGDEDIDPYWDIAQNEQIATADGPMSREELEQAEADGEFFVTEYRL